MAVDLPHLDLPFRFGVRGAVVVEQDSEREIVNCVHAILRYPIGIRDDLPEFGIPPVLFSEVDLDLDALKAAIYAWEPRAGTLLEEGPNITNPALRSVLVQVSRRGSDA